MARQSRATFCIVCGHQQVLRGQCGYCGERQEEWADLRRISQPRGVTLRCPGSTRRYGTVVRCRGCVRFRRSAFETTRNTAGNGPHTYPLDCRHGLQGRCPTCGQYWSAVEWIRGNRAAISRLARLMSEV